MKFFNDLKIRGKILSGYILVLGILLLAGGVALVNLANLERVVMQLTNELGNDRQLANDMVSQILLSRLYAVRYLNKPTQEDLDYQDANFKTLEDLITRADKEITDPGRVALLAKVKAGSASYEQSFKEIVDLIDARNKVTIETLDVQSTLVMQKVDQLQQDAFTSENLQLLNETAKVEKSFSVMRLSLFRYLELGDKKHMELFDRAAVTMDTSINKLDGLVATPEQRKLLADFRTATELYRDAVKSIQTGYERQNQLYDETLNVVGHEVRQQAAEMSASVGRDYEMHSTLTRQSVSSAQTTLIAILAGGIIIGLVLGLVISRVISRPIHEISRISSLIAVGELDQEIVVPDRSEVGLLAENFQKMIAYLKKVSGAAGEIASGNLAINIQPFSEKDVLGVAFTRMAKNLTDVIQQLSTGVSSLAGSSSQISSAAIQQSTSTQEQAAAVAETTTTIEEARQTAEQSSDRAQMVAEMARESMHLADQGLESISATIESMTAIKEQVGTIAETILLLSEQTQQIGEIISTVNDIADQSNLLAVNAAIEAARAGDAGKGFAVVANEVGNLARQSQSATAQVRDILSEIQKASNKAVMVTEEGTKRTETGSQMVDRTGKSLQTITTNFRDVAQAAQQIAASSNEQLVGMDQITTAMLNINQASKQSEAGMHTLTQAAKNLNDLASGIRKIVEQYHL